MTNNMSDETSPRNPPPGNLTFLPPELDRPKYSADVILPRHSLKPLAITHERVIVIGASTGGTQALETVLTRLPQTVLGIVIVQHMPADQKFMAMFAQRLNAICKLEVREAQHNDRVRPGLALISPCGKHMALKRIGTQFSVEILNGPLVNRHKPSVDVLFRSAALYAQANALGILMTGMGDDGAVGLKEMHEAGARTIAQDEASSVVFGMPKEAIRLGAVDEVLSLARIPDAIVSYSRKNLPPE